MQALGLTGRLGVAASARLCSDGSGALDRGGGAGQGHTTRMGVPAHGAYTTRGEGAGGDEDINIPATIIPSIEILGPII
jgi:hypothetical protein